MQNRSCKILLVDDDQSVLLVVEELLVQAGMEVTTALSGEKALELNAVQSFDVVITDIQMDGISGFELLRRLKLIDDSMKVIVMTGYNSYESVLQSLQLGAYDYIEKPIKNYAAVVATVQRAYESAKLHQDNLDLLIQLKESHDQLSAANRKLKEANRKLKRLAITDSLTKLYNRRFFDQLIIREIARRNRYKLALSVVMIDIDNFKAFNDKHGHSGGDMAIKAVAELLLKTARGTDVVARYGGEEFIVALPLTGPEHGMSFAERARKNIEQHVVEISENIHESISISVGIAGVDAHDGPISTADLLKSADEALYMSKEHGKNQCQLIHLGSNRPKAA